ncbi:efflux transporter outer membrane subunit [Parasphingorhabdus litoris]|uniref:Efflux transporter outer membrane subunit n=1 Tax=Parasphingorhabdus litoris TaxID=394733 RepID=A0ABN1AK19_9SPHN|nr:efflux transporter outer membrane subunit [Parasphingorhabdus litoris]
MSKSRVFLIIAIATALGGCASISTQQDVRDATQASLPSLPEQWQTPDFQQGSVQIGWIDRFGDSVLSELVREAQANNPDIRAAAANVDAARALVRQSRAALLPAVSATARASRQESIEGSFANETELNVGLQADWEPDLWGRLRAGRDAAFYSAEAAQADFLFAQHTLAQAVASAYFASIEARLQIGVAKRTVESLAEIDRIVRVRYREGFASAQDTAIAASDLATASETLANARGGERLARRALEQLLGRYPADRIRVTQTLPETPQTPPAGLPSELLERRPDIIAAERRVAAAFSNTDQAKAARLPIVSLTSTIGGASNELGSLLDGPNLVWSIVGSVLQPIFDGGARDAAVEEANANQRAAIAAYAGAALQALTDVENGLDQAQVLREREARQEEATRQSARAYELTQFRYLEGETDLIDALSVQQRLFNAEQGLVAIRRARLDQWIALNLALGGEW